MLCCLQCVTQLARPSGLGGPCYLLAAALSCPASAVRAHFSSRRLVRLGLWLHPSLVTAQCLPLGRQLPPCPSLGLWLGPLSMKSLSCVVDHDPTILLSVQFLSNLPLWLTWLLPCCPGGWNISHVQMKMTEIRHQNKTSSQSLSLRNGSICMYHCLTVSLLLQRKPLI